MRCLSILCAILVVGCVPPKQDWETSPRTHTCTREETARVEHDTTFCSAESGYSKSYCYGAAILRICKLRQPDQKAGD